MEELQDVFNTDCFDSAIMAYMCFNVIAPISLVLVIGLLVVYTLDKDVNEQVHYIFAFILLAIGYMEVLYWIVGIDYLLVKPTTNEEIQSFWREESFGLVNDNCQLEGVMFYSSSLFQCVWNIIWVFDLNYSFFKKNKNIKRKILIIYIIIGFALPIIVCLCMGLISNYSYKLFGVSVEFTCFLTGKSASSLNSVFFMLTIFDEIYEIFGLIIIIRLFIVKYRTRQSNTLFKLNLYLYIQTAYFILSSCVWIGFTILYYGYRESCSGRLAFSIFVSCKSFLVTPYAIANIIYIKKSKSYFVAYEEDVNFEKINENNQDNELIQNKHLIISYLVKGIKMISSTIIFCEVSDSTSPSKFDGINSYTESHGSSINDFNFPKKGNKMKKTRLVASAAFQQMYVITQENKKAETLIGTNSLLYAFSSENTLTEVHFFEKGPHLFKILRSLEQIGESDLKNIFGDPCYHEVNRFPEGPEFKIFSKDKEYILHFISYYDSYKISEFLPIYYEYVSKEKNFTTFISSLLGSFMLTLRHQYSFLMKRNMNSLQTFLITEKLQDRTKKATASQLLCISSQPITHSENLYSYKTFVKTYKSLHLTEKQAKRIMKQLHNDLIFLSGQKRVNYKVKLHLLPKEYSTLNIQTKDLIHDTMEFKLESHESKEKEASLILTQCITKDKKYFQIEEMCSPSQIGFKFFIKNPDDVQILEKMVMEEDQLSNNDSVYTSRQENLIAITPRIDSEDKIELGQLGESMKERFLQDSESNNTSIKTLIRNYSLRRSKSLKQTKKFHFFNMDFVYSQDEELPSSILSEITLNSPQIQDEKLMSPKNREKKYSFYNECVMRFPKEMKTKRYNNSFIQLILDYKRSLFYRRIISFEITEYWKDNSNDENILVNNNPKKYCEEIETKVKNILEL